MSADYFGLMGDEDFADLGEPIGLMELGEPIGMYEAGAPAALYQKPAGKAALALKRTRVQLARMAQSRTVSTQQFAAALQRISAVEQALMAGARRSAGSGFAGPGAARGSHGVPLGLGNTTIAPGASATLTQRNNRGVILRIRRIILSAAFTDGKDALPGLYVTAIFIGELPIESGGNLPADIFHRDAVSPISLDNAFHPGTEMSVALTAPANNSATLSVAGAAECGQYSGIRM